ncbi:MAG: efflux RND transporter periplasmic adaptor subunit, partial [Pseudarcicella sp.]|nr:efflux RND transporter periplasmic adaptor subunit [Pseudarcicella sp.]
MKALNNTIMITAKLKTGILMTLLMANISILESCNKKSKDKNEALAQLKAEKTKIEADIKTLEAELGVTQNKAEERIITVAVSPLVRTKFERFVEAQGLVVSKNIVKITPSASGAITGLFVSEGQVVKKGQLVATLDNQIMKETISEIKNQLELATTLFNKQKNLWDQQIGTEVQYLTAKSNKESLEKRIMTMQTTMALSNVYAPISGTIEMVFQKQGEMGMPGMPIAQIVNVGDLKISAKVADTYIGTVKKGANVNVSFPDINKEIGARISLITGVVDPVSRTFGVEANIPNLGGSLKPNQLAVVKINDYTSPSALVVPQNIIQKTETGDIVYIVSELNGKKVAKSKTVKTGISFEGKIEILEG